MAKYQLALGCAGLVAAAAAAMPPFGDWAEEASIENLGGSGDLNTTAVDGCASHSPDGLTLVFNSNRRNPTVFLRQDLYIATRASKSDGFDNPVALDELNTPENEFCPTIVRGNRIYFSKGVLGGELGDIHVTKRTGQGWSEPERLGDHINTAGAMEETAAVYEDEDGREVMLFSRRGTSPTSGRIYESIAGGPAVQVNLGASVADNRPSVTHDGLTMFFDSVRPGNIGGPDLYMSTRESTSDPWGAPTHLANLSADNFDARPFISWDGTFLTFSSTREGAVAPDMWFTTREKATGN